MNLDFILIGAQKSGTTAVASYLSQHPELAIRSDREPSFFAFPNKSPDYVGPGDELANINFIHDLGAYTQFLNSSGYGRLRGENSVVYLYLPQCAINIQRMAPQARIIVILRDPVDRAYSSYMHLRRDGRETELDFARALELEPSRRKANWETLWHYREVGNYADQLQRYFDTFPQEQLLIVRYEELRDDMSKVLARVCEFLSVDATYQFDTSYRMNQSGLPRWQALNDFLERSSSIKSVFKRLVPRRVGQRLKAALQRQNLRPGNSMSPDIRQQLRRDFRPQVESLEQLLQMKFKSWQ